VNEIYRRREQVIKTSKSQLAACFPPATLDSTGLPSEGKSFRNNDEDELLKLV
jgi:hypothetical protein